MTVGPRIDRIARLLADRSRAEMVSALMDGRQWTGRELARAAHVTPSTASSHLQRLMEGDIVTAVAHGRHKFYRISNPDVARALEALMNVAPIGSPRHRDDRTIEAKLRQLRTCYDHLAGSIAVAISDRFVALGAIRVNDFDATITPSGLDVFARFGITIDVSSKPRRPLCRPCLDWSERRYHIAGRAGAEIARHAFDSGWVASEAESRALEITDAGMAALRDGLGIDATRLTAGNTST